MLIGGLDIGTTGCKITVYTDKGEFVKSSYKEYTVRRSGGEHEINAEDIKAAVFEVLSECGEISALGVTSFGEAFVMTDSGGNVLLPSMLYTDPRGAAELEELKEKLGAERITEICAADGHIMYSMPKIMWVKNNLPEIYKNVRHIMLMEDYIVSELCGKYFIDYSLAARTMAFDVRNKCWSEEIFSAAGVDMSLMSVPVKSGSIAGRIFSEIADRLNVRDDIIIINGCHDQVAAAIGAGITEIGMAVDGTGTVECVTPVFDEIPENAQLYREGYSVVPYALDDKYVCYALSFTGGAVLKWYRDCFAKYEKEKAGDDVYKLLDSVVPDAPTDILVLPHFAGAANPYMDTLSSAAMVGITLETTAPQIYKALMEGVTYEIKTNIEHLKGFGINPKSLYATGGGASSPVWLQIKADILGMPITALKSREVGACGTCMLAAVSLGVYNSLTDAARAFVKCGKTYYPREKYKRAYEKKFGAYKKLYCSVRDIAREAKGGFESE